MTISRTEAMLVAGGVALLGIIGNSFDKKNAQVATQNRQLTEYQQALKKEVGADKFVPIEKSIQATNCSGKECINLWRTALDSSVNANKMFEAGKKFVLDSISNATKI